MSRLLSLFAALALSALVSTLAGCGEKKDITSPSAAKPFAVMLDFFPNADHTAIYSAIDSGDFHRGGLDVSLQTPSDPASPLKLLAAGRVDMAISYEPELLLARDAGLHLVSIGALVQRPLTSIIALGDRHIARVADLRGKRVGTAGIPYQSAELRTILRRAGVPPSSVTEVNVGFNLVPAMLAGKVDATLGGFWNYEGVQLSLARKQPTVIAVDQAGVPTYDELVLVVREDEAHSRGPQLRAFLQGLTRGEQEVQANPTKALRGLLAANHDLDGRLQANSVKQTLPATRPARGRPFGYQDPAAWAAFGRWMYQQRLLKQLPVAGQALTNEFLPGQGL